MGRPQDPTLTAEEGPALDRAVAADRGVARTAIALTLGEGFALYALMCQSAQVAESVLRVLDHMAPGRSWTRLATRLGGRCAPGAAPEEAVEEMLAQLTAARAGRDGQEVVVVDATDSAEADAGVWELLFHRMNRARNLIAGRLGVPLLMLMPPRMEAAFAHAAPDFWSIRSVAERVRVDDLAEGKGAERIAREVAQLAKVPQGAPAVTLLDLKGKLRPEGADQPGAGHARKENPDASSGDAVSPPAPPMPRPTPSVIGAPRPLRAPPSAPMLPPSPTAPGAPMLPPRRSTAGPPSQSRSTLLGAGAPSFMQPRPATAAAVPTPQSPEDALLEARDAFVRGDDALHGGTRAFAKANYALAAARLDAIRPTHALPPEAVHLLATAWNRLGDIGREEGDHREALTLYHKALQLRRELFSKNPHEIELGRALVRSLQRVAEIDRQDVAEVLSLRREAVRVSRALLDAAPGDSTSMYDLIFALIPLGTFGLNQQDRDLARSAFSDALAVARRFVALAPYDVVARYALAAALIVNGTFQDAVRGSDSARLWTEALGELEALLAREPDNVDWNIAANMCREALGGPSARLPAREGGPS